MKDWVPVVTVGLGLAGLMLALHMQTQDELAGIRSSVDRLDDRLTTQIESLDDRVTSQLSSLDGRVYELNERVTRVETRILEAVQP